MLTNQFTLNKQASSSDDPKSEVSQWRYHAFISYSTGADYRLANQLEVFLERFHREPGVDEYGLASLSICLDGSDFRLPRRGRKHAEQDGPQKDAIQEVVRGYLERSASLLVLWPGTDQASQFMDWELREFLAQNKRYGWDRPVRLAVTRGSDPAAKPETFFSSFQIEKALHRDIFYDFRGREPEHERWVKVRDFEKERFRLAIELANPTNNDGNVASADDIYPSWKREQFLVFRRERLNLGFRGAIGFGGASALLAIAFYIYAVPREWVVALGIPIAGALGGLVCSFHLRSAAAFMCGFAVLVPLYVLGSLGPFNASTEEEVLFFCASVFGFSAAGGIGGVLSKQTTWSAGARAFFWGGIVAAVSWFIGVGPWLDPLSAQLLAPPLWRRWLVVVAKLPRALEDVNAGGYLIPLMFGAIIAGWRYGRSLSITHSPLQEENRKPTGKLARITRAIESHSQWWAAAIVLLFFAALVPIPSAYDCFVARHRLTPELFRNMDDSTYELARIKTILRAKNAIAAAGDSAKVIHFDQLLEEGVKRSASKGYYDNPNGSMLEIVRALADERAAKNANQYLSLAYEKSKGAKDVAVMGWVSRGWIYLGDERQANEVLNEAMRIYEMKEIGPHRSSPVFDEEEKSQPKERKFEPIELSRLATALYEAKRKDEAKQLLDVVFATIRQFYQENPRWSSRSVWFDREAGKAVWGTGIWTSLAPEWCCELGISQSAAEAMLQDGKEDTALEIVFHPKSAKGEWHIHSEFAGAAARQGKYAVAFKVLEHLRENGNSRVIDQEIECLQAITDVAAGQRDNVQLRNAVTECRSLLAVLDSKESGSYDDYETGQSYLKIGKLLAEAGDLTGAELLYEKAGQDRTELLVACAKEYTRLKEMKKARKLLARAWGTLYSDSGWGDKRDGPLHEIGEAWARAGEFRAARHIAEEYEAPALFLEEHRLQACDIYIAILETRQRSPAQ